MKIPDSQILVIFGASGDLTKRKLLPALYELFIRGLLPRAFKIVCAARTAMSSEEFRRTRIAEMLEMSDATARNSSRLGEFFGLVEYFPFDIGSADGYFLLRDEIHRVRSEASIGDNIVFYMGAPPAVFPAIVDGIRACGLAAVPDGGSRRIVVEKPFGTDLKSARALNEKLRSCFHEDSIFRIDHYLGKETVQNIVVLRFSNGIFEPLWNRNYIDSVAITASETVGVERRGSYYERAGALRDMVQNHLLTLMAFVSMECPSAFDSASVRNEIVKVLKSLRPMGESDIRRNVFRGQYSGGNVGGKAVCGYRDEPGVEKNSEVETYVAMKFFIDNWRWGGVPFYFYTGKRMSKKLSEIVINFKSAPQMFFAGQCCGRSCNRLVLRIQPDEGVSLKFALKVPGAGFQSTQVSMDFDYSSLADITLPDAYARLLLDAVRGASALFARSDAVEEGWKFIDPIEDYWKNCGSEIPKYPAGSDGTTEGVELSFEHSGASCSLPIKNELTVALPKASNED